MTFPDEAMQVLVTDVAARRRPAGALSSRSGRVRCTHCAMPARGSEPTCWSCGLDPASPADPTEEDDPSTDATAPARQTPRWVTAGTCALAVLLVVLLVAALVLAPGDGAPGVRGLAERVRGEGWRRSGVQGASAEFPVRPVRYSVPTGPDGSQVAEGLVAEAPGLRVELWALAGAPPGQAGALLDDLAVAAGKRIDMAAAAEGPPRTERLVVQGVASTTRVRTTVHGSSAYLLAVTGPAGAFERFTASFHLGS